MKNLLLKSLGAVVVVAAIIGVKLGGGANSERAMAPEQNKRAPVLTGTNWLNSQPITLSSRQGKVTLVGFSAFPSPQSQTNLPLYRKLAHDYRSKGVEIIGVYKPSSELNNRQKSARLVKERNINFPVLIDENNTNSERWQTKVLPTTYLIDRKGFIRYQWENEIKNDTAAEVVRRIDALLNEDGKINLVPPTGKITKITKTDAQWRAQLSKEAYDVLRHEGTERSYTSPLNKIKETGVFVCAGCNLPLFASKTKFESGTGWPSFYQPLSKNVVVEKTDTSYGMSRTEVECARCAGHLGHVFDDGPEPTGLRYCMNGVALKFIKTGK
jgi:peptide-methionine (R)-S-oxide reductase